MAAGQLAFILLCCISLSKAEMPRAITQNKDWLKVEIIEAPEYCPFNLDYGDKVMSLHCRTF